jgi:hypothetical protein
MKSMDEDDSGSVKIVPAESCHIEIESNQPRIFTDAADNHGLYPRLSGASMKIRG